MSKKIEDLLAEAGAAAENYDIEDTLPDNVEVKSYNRNGVSI